jgi:hypothetical protein
MTDNHSAIGKQTEQLQPLVSIYVDLQNAHLIQTSR